MAETLKNASARWFIIFVKTFYMFLAASFGTFGLISPGLILSLPEGGVSSHERTLNAVMAVVFSVVATWFFFFIVKQLEQRKRLGIKCAIAFHGLLFIGVVVACVYQFRHWFAYGPDLTDYFLCVLWMAVILVPPFFFLLPQVRAEFR
jgi:hypothetical protein